MPSTLQQYFQSDPVGSTLTFLGLLLAYVCVGLPIVCAFLYGIYYLLTLPMRRNERARLFLDLLEIGLANGKTAEATVMDAAGTRDKSLGKPLRRLAANLHNGMSFADALDRATRLLSPQVRAMLKAGFRIGEVRKVMPACRQLLRDGVSQVRGALNYLILIFFFISPLLIGVPIMFGVMILPKYKEVFAGVGERPLPAFTEFMFANHRILIAMQVAVLLFGWLVTLTYLGGPRLRGLLRMLTHVVGQPARNWLAKLLVNLPDALIYRLPWKRKRLQRDFSTMLSVLLDAGMPEMEAVSLAAESTANHSIICRAEKVCKLLAGGKKLTDALRVMDDAGELEWRLRNALHRGSGFIRALTGWHETLDAKAFQQEQAAAQVATTGLVLFNGAVVAVFVTAIFLALISLIEQVTPW